MKTKEISFTLPFMIVLYELIFFRSQSTERRTPNLKRLWVLIPFLLTLLIIPLSLVGADRSAGSTIGELREAAQETEEIPRGVYFLTQFKVITTYIRLLFLPIQQNLDYDFSLSYSLLDPKTSISFLFLLSIFVAALYLLKRSWKTQNGYGLLISFGILWFFITLSVESSIIPIRDVIFEHRLYLPSVGAIIAFCSVVFYMLVDRKQKTAPLLTACILMLIAVPLGIGAYQRNFVWKNEVLLWEDVVRKSPGKARGHNNLGLAYYKQGRVEEAIQQYLTAIKLKPDYLEAHQNLGGTYAKQGRVEEAIQEYLTALRLKPDYPGAHNNLGLAYYNQGRLEEAIKEYAEALRLKPDFAEAHYNLGLVYYDQRRLDEAIKEYTSALKLKPDYLEAHQNLAGVYYHQGRLDEAIQELMIALRLNPNHADTHYNLGNIYKTRGFMDEAKREFETVLELRPNDPKARQAIESLENKGMR
jgi:tetratricopeptide (TPR) repeat protein